MRLRFGSLPAAVTLGFSGSALAQSPPDTAELLRRLEAAERRIEELERRLEAQDTAAKAAPQVIATPTRYSIGTADGENFVRFRAMLHADGRHFEGGGTPATANEWLIRRARPIVEGTFGEIFDFRLMPDFGSGRAFLQDAFVSARFRPWAAVTVGKFKTPVGLEALQSAHDVRFVERAFVSSLLPIRDLGVQLGGELGGSLFTYSMSYTNGTLDGAGTDSNPMPDQESDGKGDVAARVFLHPFVKSGAAALRGLGLGIGGTYVDSTGSESNPLLPTYRSPGQLTIFSYRATTAASATAPAVNGTFADGVRFRLSPQLYYTFRNISVMGEYASVRQGVSRLIGAATRSATLDHTAWHLQFSWLLTGENESFRLPDIKLPYHAAQPGWGAFEVVARIHELNLDDEAFTAADDSFANPATAVSRARSAGLGLNWYLNPNVKWMLHYDYTRFDGGATAGDRPAEQAYFTRVGVAF